MARICTNSPDHKMRTLQNIHNTALRRALFVIFKQNNFEVFCGSKKLKKLRTAALNEQALFFVPISRNPRVMS